MYRQTSYIGAPSLRCRWSIACRRCSNYIFILHPTLGFNILRKDSCKPRQETFKLRDLLRLILQSLRFACRVASSQVKESACFHRRPARDHFTNNFSITIQIWWKLLYSHPHKSVVITTNCCTWHHSCTVVACAFLLRYYHQQMNYS